MAKKLHLPKTLLDHTIWDKEPNAIWPGTTFVLHRNLANAFFPSKMDATQLRSTFLRLCDGLLHANELSHPTVLKAEELSPVDKEYLFEHFLVAHSFENASNGQGFIVDESGQFLALLNVQDHLQMQWSDTGGAWDNAWSKLSALEMELGKSMEFAYAPRFGYLTSDPHVCGTGLLVRAYLHVPALIHSKQLHAQEEAIRAAGIDNREEAFIGDVLVLSNRYTLGISEENVMSTLHGAAIKWAGREKTLREELRAHESPAIKDEVGRAYGLLMHSYQLQTKEVLDALSLLKLGLDLNWISGIEARQLDALFFRCQRAHLLFALGEEHAEDLSHQRAHCVHDSLKDVVCTIES